MDQKAKLELAQGLIQAFDIHQASSNGKHFNNSHGISIGDAARMSVVDPDIAKLVSNMLYSPSEYSFRRWAAEVLDNSQTQKKCTKR